MLLLNERRPTCRRCSLRLGAHQYSPTRNRLERDSGCPQKTSAIQSWDTGWRPFLQLVADENDLIHPRTLMEFNGIQWISMGSLKEMRWNGLKARSRKVQVGLLDQTVGGSLQTALLQRGRVPCQIQDLSSDSLSSNWAQPWRLGRYPSTSENLKVTYLIKLYE